jgi:hypothetical protein
MGMTEQQRYHEAQRTEANKVAAQKAAKQAGNTSRDPNYEPRHATA